MYKKILFCRFASKVGSKSINKYQNYLSKHIVDSLQRNQKQFQLIQPYFCRVLNDYSRLAQIKSRLNMLYNSNNLKDTSLSRYSQVLSEMIIKKEIQNQSELDRIVEWLRKTVKFNNEIGEHDIRSMINQGRKIDSSQHKQFESTVQELIKDIKQENELNIQPTSLVSRICKQMRQSFFGLDSKYIFERVSSICKEHSKKNQQGTTIKKNNQFWDKIDSIRPRILQQQCNSKQVYEDHLAITKGIKRFRFPPEPNGYLHIGHAKAMRINFETALRQKGQCYLRFDDTNPETESQQFMQEIQQNVNWIGYVPDKITFASDYFDQMLHYAHQLIREGNAYVCERTAQQMENQRKNKLGSPFRDRPIEHSLKIFPNLESGQTLRLKANPQSANPNLRDPVIYRLKNSAKPHPRTGNKYKIYPIYDFAHSISDSIEHIDYSLCSLEFQVRRELYYRYLHLLNLYKPMVWEYSRLNIEGNVLSKRKIKALIQSGQISDWSDPRLLTIRGLRNRGYTPYMVTNFIDKINSSRTGNENIIQHNLLERSMKKELFLIARKTMAVLYPVEIKIINFQEILNQSSIQIQVYPGQATKKELRTIKLGSKICLQQKQLNSLQQGEQVVLKYAGLYKLQMHESEKILRYICKIEELPEKIGMTMKEIQREAEKRKIKKLHWICPDEAIEIPITLYETLFKIGKNEEATQLNPNSKTELKNCLIHKDLLGGSKQDYWQFQRLGYFKWNEQKRSMIRCCAL